MLSLKSAVFLSASLKSSLSHIMRQDEEMCAYLSYCLFVVFWLEFTAKLLHTYNIM